MLYFCLPIKCTGSWYGFFYLDSWYVPIHILSLAVHPGLCGTSGHVWSDGLHAVPATAHHESTLQTLALEDTGQL